MAEELAIQLGIDPTVQIPLPMVSFLYERVHGRRKLTTYIINRLTVESPSETHRILAEIVVHLHRHRSLETNPVELIITTNYDQQLENELNYLNRGLALKPPLKVRPIIPSSGRQQIQQWEEDSLNLLKLHGCVSDSESLIVTDEDYIKVLNSVGGSAATKYVDVTIQGYIPRAGLLFLGYSLGDWDFRAFYESLMQGRASSKKYDDYAIQRRPGDAKETKKWDVIARYWQEKRVKVIDSLASDVLRDVSAKL